MASWRSPSRLHRRLKYPDGKLLQAPQEAFLSGMGRWQPRVFPASLDIRLVTSNSLATSLSLKGANNRVNMSFGFSVGDFLAVGKLSIRLWRSFKDAPQEFAEVSRELSSVNIVIADLSDQAGSLTSLLNRRGASRKDELMTLCDNLMGVLEEL
ncbi:hypothetical protein ACEPPN_011999 [Leptodophora sp. 'Broadleaf-Isolate-01']